MVITSADHRPLFENLQRIDLKSALPQQGVEPFIEYHELRQEFVAGEGIKRPEGYVVPEVGLPWSEWINTESIGRGLEEAASALENNRGGAQAEGARPIAGVAGKSTARRPFGPQQHGSFGGVRFRGSRERQPRRERYARVFEEVPLSRQTSDALDIVTPYSPGQVNQDDREPECELDYVFNMAREQAVPMAVLLARSQLGRCKCQTARGRPPESTPAASPTEADHRRSQSDGLVNSTPLSEPDGRIPRPMPIPRLCRWG